MMKIEVRGDVFADSIEVKQEVYQLAQDQLIRKSVAGAVRPLRNPGIAEFKVRYADRVIESVRQDEVDYLMESLEAEAEDEMDSAVDLVPPNTRPAALEIFRPSFKEDNKWSFSDGSGGSLFARIEDQEFLDRVNRHEITFGKGDVLQVLLLTRTTRSPGGKLVTEHTIVKVLRFISAPQLRLFPPHER